MTTDTRPLETQFTLAADEFLEGQRTFNKWLAPRSARFNYRYAVPVGMLLVAEAVVGLILRWSIGFNLALLFFGAYLISCRTIIGPRKMKKEFTQYSNLSWNQSWEFREDKVLVQTPQGKSEVDWKRFTRFIETQDLFVLFVPPRFLHIVPKRALPSGASDRLRSLLERKLQS